MLNELKRFNAEATTDIEELLSLSLQAQGLRNEFTRRSLATPEWLDDVNRRIDRAIEVQTADQRELMKKQLLAQRETLLSRSEVRAKIDAQLAEIGVTVNK